VRQYGRMLNSFDHGPLSGVQYGRVGMLKALSRERALYAWGRSNRRSLYAFEETSDTHFSETCHA
jgi:hypothetical protein